MIDRGSIGIMLLSSLCTFIAIPLWFFAAIAILSPQSDNVNNAGIQAYFVSATAVSLPTALFAGCVAGPCTVWLSRLQLHLAFAGLLILLAIACSLNVLRPAFFALLPASFGWILLPYNLTAFLAPPLLLGILAFVGLACRRASCMPDGG